MSVLGSAAAYVELKALRGAARLAPGWFEEQLFRIAEVAAESIPYAPGREFARRMLRVGREVLPRACPRCRTKIIDNLLATAVTGKRVRAEYARRTGLEPPYFLVISPTMRCNLRCPGCYAAQYSKDDEMPLALLDRVLGEARAMGMNFITISGGEPFLREDLAELFEQHSDMYFQVYTNGTPIDDSLADRLAALGNVLPMISIDGFEAETDRQRGRGTFRLITAAMDRLRERGVPFGFSATADRGNSETVVSDEFVDFLRGKGCSAGWYFNFMPVGDEAALERMPTAGQRMERRRRLAELRQRLPMMLLDFWNDGDMIGGCMAAGRYYAHINVHGDVEPCVFAHFAVDNVRSKPLHACLDSPFFRGIRARQPYSHNHLRGCMIIDHPHVLRETVRESGARPTCAGAGGIITGLAAGLDRRAAEWAAVADAEWAAQAIKGEK